MARAGRFSIRQLAIGAFTASFFIWFGVAFLFAIASASLWIIGYAMIFRLIPAVAVAVVAIPVLSIMTNRFGNSYAVAASTGLIMGLITSLFVALLRFSYPEDGYAIEGARVEAAVTTLALSLSGIVAGLLGRYAMGEPENL